MTCSASCWSNSECCGGLSLYGDRITGRIVKWLLRLLRHTDPDRAADVCGAIARTVGPLLPAHRIGRANLRAAYPDRDPAWIEATLRGAWDNLGRVAGEYVHLGRVWDYDPAHPNHGRILTDDEPLFLDLLNDGKPALCFAAHLGNWELPAVAAAAHGLPSAVVYRMPNNKAVAKEIVRIRAPLMGRLIRTRAQAALEMAASLDRGEHLGMLVDQHFSARRGRYVLWPPLQGEPDGRPAGAPIRLPRRRGARGAPARPAVSYHGRRSVHTAARRRRPGGRGGNHADDHRRGGTLDPRTPRAMVVVPSPMAVTVPAVQHFVNAQRCRVPQLWQGGRVARDNLFAAGELRPCAPRF